MSQGAGQVPTVGPVTPTAFAGNINTALLALFSRNSGNGSPANISGGPLAFQSWANTTVAALPTYNEYDGAQWVYSGTLDATNHVWKPKLHAGIATSIQSLVANTNNWNPTLSNANRVRVTATPAINLTGFQAQPDGTIIILDCQSGSSNITLTAQDTANSSAANCFYMPRPVILRANQTLAIEYDATVTGWRVIGIVEAQPILGGFKNLQLGNAALRAAPSTGSGAAPGTPNTQYRLTADQLALEDANGTAVRVGPFNVIVDTATVNAPNGTDNSAIGANAQLYYWVIYNPATNTVAGVVTTSTSAPNLAGGAFAGYTFKARVGYNMMDGATHLFVALQSGRRGHYSVPHAFTITVGFATIVPASWSSVCVQWVWTAAPTAQLNMDGNICWQLINSNVAALAGYHEIWLEPSSSNPFTSGGGTTSISIIGWEDNI